MNYQNELFSKMNYHYDTKKHDFHSRDLKKSMRKKKDSDK